MAYRDALLDELRPKVPGIQAPVDPTTYLETGSGPTAPPRQPAKNYLEGSSFDMGKINDPTHNTERYQVGRVFQKYDPSLGLQQAGLLDDLNALGLGDFYAENGDRLGVKNVRGGARWHEGVGDVITNYTGAGPKAWNPLMTPDAGGATAAAPLGGAGAAVSAPTIAPPTRGLTQSEMGLPQQTDASPYLAALLAQLGL